MCVHLLRGPIPLPTNYKLGQQLKVIYYLGRVLGNNNELWPLIKSANYRHAHYINCKLQINPKRGAYQSLQVSLWGLNNSINSNINCLNCWRNIFILLFLLVTCLSIKMYPFHINPSVAYWNYILSLDIEKGKHSPKLYVWCNNTFVGHFKAI